MPDVWAERVIAVAVVVVGTLLNGWGTAFRPLLGLAGVGALIKTCRHDGMLAGPLAS